MKLKKIMTAALISTSLFAITPNTQAGMQPFVGEIDWFAGNFPPRGWAFCDGQLLSISSNTALFSILGTTYGGDGRTTFALPDVRGRTLIHMGTGPGLSPRLLGQRSGTENETLTLAEMPAHTHTLKASDGSATAKVPAGNVMASPGRTRLYDSSDANVNMDESAITTTGGSAPMNNMQPYNTLSCIIALTGIYPSRN